MDPSLLPPEVAAGIRLGNFLYQNSRMAAAANHFPHHPLPIKTERSEMAEMITSSGQASETVGNTSPPSFSPPVMAAYHAAAGYPQHRNGDFHHTGKKIKALLYQICRRNFVIMKKICILFIRTFKPSLFLYEFKFSKIVIFIVWNNLLTHKEKFP